MDEPNEAGSVRYPMLLLQPTYIIEIPPNRFPAGAVIEVDGDTAFRWVEHGVAKPAPSDARTFRDEQRDRKARFLADLREHGGAVPVYDASITRESLAVQAANEGPRDPMPKRMPARRGRGALEREQVVNAEQEHGDLSMDDEE